MFILNDNSCKILYITHSFGLSVYYLVLLAYVDETVLVHKTDI